MGLWAVNYAAGARGCPVYLRGDLNQPWEWDQFDPEPPASVPSGYVFSAKHPVVDFDFWGTRWMASERFLEVCRRFGLRVHPIPVEVLQQGGKPAAKPYYFLLWSEWASIIDLDAAAYELERVYPSGDLAHWPHHPGAPMLLSVEAFVVDESKVPAAAAFLCLDLDNQLVCTDEFKQACEGAGLLGLEFVEVHSYTKAGFWG